LVGPSSLTLNDMLAPLVAHVSNVCRSAPVRGQ
jgi:hypothetical protein